MLLDDDALLDLRPRASPTDPAAVVREETRLRVHAAPAANGGLEQARDAHAAPPTGCHVCGREARHTCGACAQAVCAADRWAMFGLCVRCATAERMARWHTQPRAEARNWLEGA